ncbi:hypothetical protein ASPZODRAFT_146239 [Penicilliopsis zonata CBS 506.65]|uniref:Glutaminase n=1 Tax=Penicilliopsis zonata CBS 506.65 TaxID=1073090 RepID=A0A1L9S7T6_9EURO|nr:hypothetical protein ASPZODRAFT_146239 [Penicilliopsis zonata CBS 506.65]OJJ43220.1 hypothetical protein ASPZODRAFT_146239 [Penicilliopsis zonata CBS 506.65]
MAFAGILTACLLLLPHVSSTATFTPLLPPAYPLAVRSPYLSAWLPGNAAENLPSSRSQFWYGNELNWSLIARVDDVAYNLFGVVDSLEDTKNATVTEGKYTSTHSIFTLTAGAATITLDFLSPVSPTNYLRQSLPFSYLTVTVKASGQSVQIYSDIDDSWTGQSTSSEWSYATNGSTAVYQISAKDTATYSQNTAGQALWGDAVYATRPGNSSGSKLTAASGPVAAVRAQFVGNGTLDDTHEAWTSGGVVGFAQELGTVSESAAVTFAIGHVRLQSINYLGAAQTGYYRATYPETVAAVSHFLDDYTDADSDASSLDELIQKAGEESYSAGGSNYSDILALSVRQVYGGMELTIPDDTLDTSSPRAFIKEISSDGNINTVDVIYATFPLLYALDATWIKLLLRPVLEYSVSDLYTEDYAVHDLGADYPNATGHLASGESMPVEESGNIVIMSHAYTKASGNDDLATTYADLLEKYATYLLVNGEYPAKQLSLNDGLGELANQTNLGIKAAVGLAAYGALTGQDNYTTAGQGFATTIYTDRVGTDASGSYFTIQYGIEPWFLVFNLYPDILLGLDVFPEAAYNATSAFYPTAREAAGLPLDGSLAWGQTNWQSYVAATVTGAAREMLIADLHAYISNGLNAVPFSDKYWVKNGTDYVAGEYDSFRARPTLGSHFALMALLGENQLS